MSKRFWRDTSAEIEMTYKHMKRSSLVLIMRHHHTPAIKTKMIEWQCQVLTRKWDTWNSHTGLLGMQNGSTPWEKLYIFFSFFLKKIIHFIEGWLLYRILLFSVKPQQESAIGIHISPPVWTSLPSPAPSHPSRLIQSPCLSFLSQTANSRWLSISHMVMKKIQERSKEEYRK